MQLVGSASGEDEIEYWRTRRGGSMRRNSSNDMAFLGNRSRRARQLTCLAVISVASDSEARRSSSFLSFSSWAYLAIVLIFCYRLDKQDG